MKSQNNRNQKKERGSSAKYQRIMVIDKEVASGRYPTIKDLCNIVKDCKGGSSRATVCRDIKTLREEFNAPILFNKEAGGYEYVKKTFRIPALLTTETQIKAARLILNLIEVAKGTPLYDDAKEVFDTLSTVAPLTKSNGEIEEESLISDDEKKRIIFLGAPPVAFSSETWKLIKEAISKNQIISFLYKTSYANAKEKRRAIQPWQLIFDDGSWSVWGCDYYDKKRKLFSVSSIKNITIRKETFTLPEDFDFRLSTPGAFGCYTEQEFELYKIRFTGYAAHTASSRIWGKNQTVKENKDGSITVSFESNQYYPILRWVMSWGADAIPLSPKVFVQDWKNRVQETNRVSKLK